MLAISCVADAHAHAHADAGQAKGYPTLNPHDGDNVSPVAGRSVGTENRESDRLSTNNAPTFDTGGAAGDETTLERQDGDSYRADRSSGASSAACAPEEQDAAHPYDLSHSFDVSASDELVEQGRIQDGQGQQHVEIWGSAGGTWEAEGRTSDDQLLVEARHPRGHASGVDGNSFDVSTPNVSDADPPPSVPPTLGHTFDASGHTKHGSRRHAIGEGNTIAVLGTALG